MMGMTTHERDRALSRLGQLREQFSGRLQQRLERLAELVERAQREPDTGALAEAISTAHRLAGTAGSYGYVDVGESVASLERALQIRERALGPGHPDVAQSLNNLGVVLKNLDRFEDAQAHYDRALQIRTDALEVPGEPAHPGIPDGEWIRLVVSDTGEGMSEETAERIFEPFFSTKDASKGTGLGLSTVYGIVQQSGGHIRVDTSPQRGTTFTILLPLGARESAAA